MLQFQKIKILIIIVLIFANFSVAQNLIDYKNLRSNFSKLENRKIYYNKLINDINIFLESNNSNNIIKWEQKLRDAQSIYLRNDVVLNSLKKSLNSKIDGNIKLQRTTIEIAYTLYPNELLKEVNQVLQKSKDPTTVAICTKYLYKKKNKIDYISLIKSKFPNYNKNNILYSVINDLNGRNELKFNKIPDVKLLLSHDFQKNKTIVYSFHRKNRNYQGITLIKKPDGNFVINNDSSIFYIPQLAISYSNLPGYIPNGNTPEGIYSIVGWYISPTETIGPTPNILVRSPFEVSPKIFFHGKNKNNKWNIDDYKSLLPNNWITYKPIYDSFKAGQYGRKLIIMHGSTDDTKYYKSFPYYPLTPTRGCLSAKEIWGDNGKCLESDQAKLINAFRSTNQKKGFLVVIELDDQQKPVQIEEIVKFINK